MPRAVQCLRAAERSYNTSFLLWRDLTTLMKVVKCLPDFSVDPSVVAGVVEHIDCAGDVDSRAFLRNSVPSTGLNGELRQIVWMRK